MTPNPAYSVYLHIPFCAHRCAYCDFNTYAGIDDLIPAYTAALCREIDLAAQSAGERLPVQTVFFGGGTPSLLTVAAVASILETIQRNYTLDPNAEITLEANPGTLSAEQLMGLREIGVNRLSLGMQSADPGELHLLERQHSHSDVQLAVAWARQAGFTNLNLDLIFGLPAQLLVTWQDTLEEAFSLEPEHLSLYALTLEHGTPLRHRVEQGALPEPDPDLAADMYDYATRRLEEAGYMQYEISNWARRDEAGEVMACRHNLQYWRSLPYLGFGAGAHGFVPGGVMAQRGVATGIRTENVLAPAAYIERLHASAPLEFPRTPATVTTHAIDRQSEIGEVMMMGLRLVQEGVSEDDFQRRFGQGLQETFAKPIEKLNRQGLLEWHVSRLRLTSRGRLLGNQVFVEFI